MSNSEHLNVSVAWAKNHHGVALVVSLVLLLALTMIGVATFTGARINDQITSNAEHKAMAFEVAESGISSVLDAGYLLDAITTQPGYSGERSEALDSDLTNTGTGAWVEHSDASKSPEVSGTVSIRYCGEALPMGSNLSADLSAAQMVSVLVDINGKASVADSTADHVQRVAITALRSNRSADCKTR